MNSPPASAHEDVRDYVHGYSATEATRLGAQADMLAPLLHEGTSYPAGSRVLEAGCGTGAQTVHLVAGSPRARITAVDVFGPSLERACARVAARAPGASVDFHHADLRDLPFADASFDHVFVCFVLEHLADPAGALAEVRRVLRPGGSLTVIEGDHGLVHLSPEGPSARVALECLVRLQSEAGGDGLIGRRLGPLLRDAGFEGVRAEHRTMHADASRPDLVERFTRATFIAMVAGVREAVLEAGLMSRRAWEAAMTEFDRTAEPGGALAYTFTKAVALRPEDHSAPSRDPSGD